MHNDPHTFVLGRIAAYKARIRHLLDNEDRVHDSGEHEAIQLWHTQLSIYSETLTEYQHLVDLHEKSQMSRMLGSELMGV